MGKPLKDRFANRARQIWREFTDGRPGRRFQDRYRRRQKSGSRSLVWRVTNIVVGVVLVALSAVGGLLPVLGWGTAIIGFALIAGEVLYAAWLLDRTEHGLRSLGPMFRDVWGAANLRGRAVILLVLAVAALLVVYFVYLVFLILF
jgi:hypothetical protein